MVYGNYFDKCGFKIDGPHPSPLLRGEGVSLCINSGLPRAKRASRYAWSNRPPDSQSDSASSGKGLVGVPQPRTELKFNKKASEQFLFKGFIKCTSQMIRLQNAG